MTRVFLIAFTLGGLINPSKLPADVVADRATLETSLIGGVRYDNDFDLSTSTNYFVNDTSLDFLDSATNVPGFGSGVVSSGVEFSSPLPGSHLILIRQTGLDITSGAIYHLGESGTQFSTLRMTFDSGVTHVGFDYFDDQLANFRGAAIEVWTIGATSAERFERSPGFGTANSQFFGFQDTSGIDFIDVTSDFTSAADFSPAIDNLTFGSAAAVPEPSHYALLMVVFFCVILWKGARLTTTADDSRMGLIA